MVVMHEIEFGFAEAEHYCGEVKGRRSWLVITIKRLECKKKTDTVEVDEISLQCTFGIISVNAESFVNNWIPWELISSVQCSFVGTLLESEV
jgi:hypothetical protein